MPSKSEVARRKSLALQIAEQARAEAAAKQPILATDLAALFDHLDVSLTSGCDHTLRFTSAFLEARQLPLQPILAWLRELGGCCDCEVLANVEG